MYVRVILADTNAAEVCLSQKDASTFIMICGRPRKSKIGLRYPKRSE